MERILYLEPDEEITSAIDRIKDLKSKNVAVVVPRDAVILQSVVNLKLLKIEIDKLDKKLSIITSDKVGRNLASQVGLAVYDKLDKEFLKPEEDWTAVSSDEVPDDKAPESAEEAIPQKGLDDIAAGVGEGLKDLDKQESKPEPAKPEVKTPIKAPSLAKPEKDFASLPKGKFKINKKLLVIGLILSVFVTAFVLFLFLPRAAVNLIVKADKIEHSLKMTVDKKIVDVNLSKNSIPGQIFEESAEKESSGQATGKKEIGEKAKGTIKIYNSYDSDAQTLKAGARLTRSGKVFLTTTAVSVPGFTLEAGVPVSGTADVSVESFDEGSEYNVSAGRFSIYGYPSDKFYGQSSNAMSGGYSKQVTVVSQADLDKLKETLAESVKPDAKKALENKIQGDYEVLEDALKIEVVSFTSNHKVDEQVSEFTGKATVKAKALVYKKEDFKKVVEENFKKVVTTKEKELVEINYDDMKKVVKSVDIDKGKMSLSLSGVGFAGPKLDEKKLKQNLIRKDRIRAEEYLTSFAEVESVQIDLWPFWVKKVPAIDRSIKIKIDYQAEKTANK